MLRLKKQNGCRVSNGKLQNIQFTPQTSLPAISTCFCPWRNIWPARCLTMAKRWRNEVTTWLCAKAAEFCHIRIQKLVPRLNIRLDKGDNNVGRIPTKCFFHSILLISIFKNLIMFVSLLSGRPTQLLHKFSTLKSFNSLLKSYSATWPT